MHTHDSTFTHITRHAIMLWLIVRGRVCVCVFSLPLLPVCHWLISVASNPSSGFCPWELPLRPPVQASPAMYPLSVPQRELPTWRANQQMVPCWNTFPLPFILLSYCNNLESLPAVPEDIFCFEALQPVRRSFLCKQDVIFPVKNECLEREICMN